MDVTEVLADLLAEHDALDAVVGPLAADQFALATPSPRWSVADQLAHLTYFDGTARLAIVDPDGFTAALHALLEAAAGGDEGVDVFVLGPYRELAPAALLAAWRDGRAALAEAARTLGEKDRVPWYGPPMSAKSFLTARMMEAWAHGQDVVDTVGAVRPPSDRLRHIVQLGFITRGWSYVNRGQEVPAGTVRLEVTSPSGESWTFGPDDADDVVTGTAEDFCLVVTQRRHVDDTGLKAGELGRHWLLRAQVFAGGPTDGPAPTKA